MRTRFLSFVGILFCFCGYAQNNRNDALATFIQTKGDSLLKAQGWPGLFVGIADNGKRQYFNFGYAVPDEKRTFDSATVFEAGSITKTFTAYIVESVLGQKKINDTASILPYLPDSVQSNKALAGITFLSLLNHTSGLPRLPDNLGVNSKTPYDNYTLADLFSYLKRCVPKPDGKSSYSNLGAGLAGVLAQRLTGKSYRQLLDDYILQPFSVAAWDGRSYYQKAQGYFNGEKIAFWNMDALAPAGGLQCNATGLLSYLEYMANPRDPKARAVINTVLKPTVAVTPIINVCRAWHTLEQKDKPVIYWHNGGTYGFSTFTAFERVSGKAVVVVVNQFNANAASDALGIAILKRLLEE